jgi:hypothetical protein
MPSRDNRSFNVSAFPLSNDLLGFYQDDESRATRGDSKINGIDSKEFRYFLTGGCKKNF